MTIDKSLRIRRGSVKARGVLKRGERITKLKEAERWEESMSVLGLPKVRVYKLTMKKKKKKKEEEEGAEGAAAAPAAGGAAAPAAKGACPGRSERCCTGERRRSRQGRREEVISHTRLFFLEPIKAQGWPTLGFFCYHTPLR